MFLGGGANDLSGFTVQLSSLAPDAPAGSDANLTSLFRIASNGYVGIGEWNPTAKLDVRGGVDRQIAAGVWADLAGSANGLGLFGGNMYVDFNPPAFKYANTHTEIGAMGFAVNYPVWNKSSVISSGTSSSTAGAVFTPTVVATFTHDGRIGVGTTDPTASLDVAGAIGSQGLIIYHKSEFRGHIWADSGGAQKVYLRVGSDTGQGFYEFHEDGTLVCPVLTIKGGADVAEPFQVSTKDIPKGAVVVIDDENPGHLKLSEQAYDTRVAGVISGANGVNPGITLNQQTLGEGGHNVALSGRVYVLADASNGRIKPGDLLTTSDTPGHAMKVSDAARARGAILGKAMTGLAEGTGMVLVLVSLQ